VKGSKVANEQHLAMAAMYKSGKSLVEVGREYGISGQRVHMIMQSLGVSREEGGVSVRRAERKAARQRAVDAALEAKLMQKWGMTSDEYAEHVAQYGNSNQTGSPMSKYLSQRKNAEKRGIQWLFTFKSWWVLWQESGLWDKRGRKSYGLGRIGDASTPFSPDTCRISTLTEIITGDFFVRAPTGNRIKQAA
jgi:hypothetical protein